MIYYSLCVISYTPHMVFPDKLVREARQTAGLTQAEFGQRLGMSQSAIAKLERPGANPTVETLDRALRAAGVHLQLAATPWPAGVDETLIAGALSQSPEERIATATQMYEHSRRIGKRGRPS
jgi:transcriptional regulator with XRE-family HTH domain